MVVAVPLISQHFVPETIMLAQDQCSADTAVLYGAIVREQAHLRRVRLTRSTGIPLFQRSATALRSHLESCPQSGRRASQKSFRLIVK